MQGLSKRPTRFEPVSTVRSSDSGAGVGSPATVVVSFRVPDRVSLAPATSHHRSSTHRGPPGGPHLRRYRDVELRLEPVDVEGPLFLIVGDRNESGGCIERSRWTITEPLRLAVGDGSWSGPPETTSASPFMAGTPFSGLMTCRVERISDIPVTST